MKKILTATLAIIMTLGVASAAYATTGTVGTSYTDIKKTNWAYEAVDTMSQKGIVKGYPNGSFKPDNTLTYGEFIKMALVAATNEDVGNASGINEQTGKKKNWAQGYYEKALELKYFRETQISLSQITNPITRGDMAIIISAILGDVKIDNYDSLEASITDVDASTKNEYDIIKSYANGILTGYTDKTFKPDRTLSRAESAVITYRLVDSSKREMPGGKKEEVSTTPPAVTEKKVNIKAFVNSTKTFEYNYKAVNLGDYGFKKFVITSNGYVAIYSTVKYDGVRLVIDNVVTSGFSNPNGTEYWVENGQYVYYAEPKEDGISVTGKTPSVIMGGMNDLLEFTDVTL